MLAHMNIMSNFDTTMLSRNFVVMRLAHFMAVGPSYDSLSLLMVMRMQRVLALFFLIETIIPPYVTLLPAGTSDQRINRTCLYP